MTTSNIARPKIASLSNEAHKCFHSIYPTARKNAAKRQIQFDLTVEDFWNLAARTKGCCQVTGLQFEYAFSEGSLRRPFAPSLDRIKSHKGYSKRNCRFVCIAANLAMNEWGESVLLKLAQGILAKANEIHEDLDLAVARHETEHQEMMIAGYMTTKSFLRHYPQFKNLNWWALVHRVRKLCKCANLITYKDQTLFETHYPVFVLLKTAEDAANEGIVAI